MIGLPDERDVELWRTSDSAIMRADLDLAVNHPTSPDEPPRPRSDAELIEAVRGGDNEAYGQLYERHVHAAHNLARQLSRSPVEVEDLVSEAFAKVLAAMHAGGGPDSAFRAYLLTVLRHTAYDRTSRDRRVELSDDLQAVSGVERVTGVPFHDTVVARLNRSLAVRAFASLPERWQTVLWHTEIEGQSPAEVAPLFGLTANGVSAMAYRAREGLRKAYVQAHVERNPADRCRATADRLGSWTRGGLSRRETAQVEAHLDKCAECRALATELTDVNAALRGTVAPLVLGVGLVGYLAGAGKAGATLAVAAPTSALSWVAPAASAAALVVAVTVGVSLPDSGTSRTPVANPPTSSVVGQQTPAGQGGSSSQTATSATSSSSAASSTASSAPAAGGSNTVPPNSTTSSTANAAPALTPVAPGSFTTSTGGPPTRVPITIRNTGTAPAPPMTLTLTLPPDVKTVGPGNNLVEGPLLQLNGAAEQTVGCPAGKGTVTCRSDQPLAPGASVTFVFRLLAGPKSQNGTMTATTDSVPPLRIDVPVTITPKK